MRLRNVFLAAIIIFMAACTKDALDITFDANYKVDLPVEVTGAKAEYDFAVSDTIDLSADTEVAKYLDRIKNWELSGLESKFTELTEDFKLITAKLTVESGDFMAEWDFNNVDITEAYNMILQNTNGQFDEINKILASKKSFIVNFTGKTDKKDIAYKLGVLVKTKVTASPLD